MKSVIRRLWREEQGAGYRGVCGDAGGNPGNRSGHDPAYRFQRQQRVFFRRQFGSIERSMRFRVPEIAGRVVKAGGAFSQLRSSSTY